MANKSQGGHVHLRKGVKASDGRQFDMAGGGGEESYALTDNEARAIKGVEDPAKRARILREMRRRQK